MFRLSQTLGYLFMWCSAIDKYRDDVYMGICVLGKKLFFTSKKDYESALNYLFENNVDYDFLSCRDYV